LELLRHSRAGGNQVKQDSVHGEHLSIDVGTIHYYL